MISMLSPSVEAIRQAVAPDIRPANKAEKKKPADRIASIVSLLELPGA